MLDTALLLLRALLLAASFAGLCAGLRVRLHLDACIAPFAAACGVIAVLMLAGMARLLFPAFCALYALGFAGLIYACAVRRESLRPGLLLALLAFAVFLGWRFYFCPLSRNDEISHWGLVAKHLLARDRLPVDADGYVWFPSYPLGSACFIYYVCRFVENSEGMYLVAQNFLYGVLFLPMFSLVRQRRRALFPILSALFFLLFHFSRYMIGLQVDQLLGFFGIGIVACAVRYRDDPKRALAAALPAMIAVVYVKNSGLFFSALGAAALYMAAPRGDRGRLRRALAAFGLCVLAFLLWELHVKLSFPNGFETKHAVSASGYAREFLSKSPALMAAIAVAQFCYLFGFCNEQCIALLVMLPCAVALLVALRPLPMKQRRRFLGCFGLSVALYFIWYLLVYLMYLFSMPEIEARALASMFRYNGTGLTLLMGLTAILLVEALQRSNALHRMLRLVSCLGVVFIALMIGITARPGNRWLGKMFDRPTQLPELRVQLQEARDACGLEDGAHVLVFWPSHDPDYYDSAFLFYSLKYEYLSGGIDMISCQSDEPGAYVACGYREWLPLDDVVSYVEERLDDVDAFLIFGESPDFEARIAPVLESCGGDAPVYRAALDVS